MTKTKKIFTLKFLFIRVKHSKKVNLYYINPQICGANNYFQQTNNGTHKIYIVKKYMKFIL